MNAAYLETATALDPGTHLVHADFSLRNDSSETWRPAEGFGVGYHLFDAETGTLIVDGARVHPARDLAPGQTERVHLDFEFPAEESGEVDARHNREYAPREIHQLLENSGFAVTLLETGEFRDEPHPEFGWIAHLLERYRLGTDLRGDGIYAVGRKTGSVKERYPGWLYA